MRSKAESRGNRYSEAEKEAALRTFDRQMAFGASAIQAASITGISPSSLYRWARKDGLPSAKNNTAATAAAEEAVKVLCSRNVDSVARRAGVFRFAFWLRWPLESINRDTALLAYKLFYLRQTRRIKWLKDIPPAELDAICESTSVDALINLWVGETGYHRGAYHKFPGGNFTERQVLADIAWYFLTSVRDHRSRPTIQKAAYLFREAAFERRWRTSESTFRKLLSANFPALPFLFIEDTHSEISFDLNPEHPDFSSRVDRIVANDDSVCLFFGRAKWVTGELTRLLDPRALAHFSIVNIPDWIEPVSVSPRPLPRKLLDALDSFSSRAEFGMDELLESDIADEKKSEK